MPAFLPQDIRNVAVVGHKGSGKTALIEAMLYLARMGQRPSRPGERMAGLDDSPEERSHGATFQSRLVTLPWEGKKLNLLDTPGDPSFFTDVQLALAVADAAILVVSARHGVETGTERIARLIREAKKPCLVVLTKVDDPAARVTEVVEQIRGLKAPLSVVEIPHRDGLGFDGVVEIRHRQAWVGGPESPSQHSPRAVPADVQEEVERAHARFVDEVAGTDDVLIEHYLAGGDLEDGELDRGAERAVAEGKLVPVFCVANGPPSGVTALLKGIVELLPSPLERQDWHGMDDDEKAVSRSSHPSEPMAAAVFKTVVDPHAGRISAVRVLSGVLRHDAHVWCQARGQRERVAQLLQGVGKDLKPVGEAVAGELVWVTKLKSTSTGDTLSDERDPFDWPFLPRPFHLYSRAVLVEDKTHEDRIAAALLRLSEEDVGLSFSHGSSRELLLSGLGAMHLDIALERLRARTSLPVRLGPPRIPYRETVTRSVTHVEGKQKKQTGGHGQFGVCFIDLLPLPRGSGFAFEDAVVGGAVPRQFIPSVEKGVRRALEQGTLAGFPVVDVKVRLVDGKHHSVDSSDAAFQVAGFKAFKLAMELAHPVLLEPVVKLEVQCPTEAMGDVIGDLASRQGKVLATDGEGEMTLITAHVPLAQTLEYEPVLTGLTHGKGRFTFQFDHYELCPPHVQERLVRESGLKGSEEMSASP